MKDSRALRKSYWVFVLALSEPLLFFLRLVVLGGGGGGVGGGGGDGVRETTGCSRRRTPRPQETMYGVPTAYVVVSYVIPKS